jgi:CHAT domain-containing protein
VQDIRLALSEAGRRNYARFVKASRRLYEILLKPAEDDLKKKKNLFISPDASLNYLPFDVLLSEEPQRTGRADFQNLPYTLKNRAIHYTPSASVLAEINNRKSQIANRKSAEFVAFGDPIYGATEKNASNRVKRFVNEIFNSANLPRLSDSSREVTTIAANFAGSAQIFLRGEAIEKNIKDNKNLKSARIIHFAAHGIINERQPSLSGLILSQNQPSGEDDFLQTEEIYALDLSADLVVLSACRTALGKNFRGEGVIGLTRAFLRSGAKSVAATLWQVEDVSTADLMIDFYKNLKTAPDKSSALREAKLTMLKNPRFAHPHFWASFVVIGAK